MKMKFLIGFMLLCVQLFGQRMTPILPYQKTDYPSKEYSTTSNTYHLGQVDILVIMVHPQGNASGIFQCRSWLMIKKNNEITDQRYYNIEPVGGCSGLFVPRKQPNKNYFILSKFGDYNGQTLIIDSNGSLVTMKGGSFSISRDGRYLFSTFDSDLSGVSIYDLRKNETIFSQESENDLRYSTIYFFKNQYYIRLEGDEDSKALSLALLDVKNKKVSSCKTPAGFLKMAVKLKEYNKVTTLSGCNCGA